MSKKNDKAINEQFIKDFSKICTDIDAGINLNKSLETINDTLMSIETEKVLHEGNWKNLDELAHFESAVLRIKIKFLEMLIANI